MAQELPTFEEWKEQKRANEDQKYRVYEDNYRSFRAGGSIDPTSFGSNGFSIEDFNGWQDWRTRNADRLDVEYTVKALDQDLVDAVRGQYKAQWGSKYYYDLFDPEDAARAADGQMPKYLDRTYDLENPYDRWLYDNGLPNRADFSDMYSQAAYDRQERQAENASLLNGIVEDWNTVYDQKEAFQNAYNAALDEKAQQSGRAPTQAEREALAQELLMSGKYDDIAAAYSALPDVQQEPDTLDAYVDRLEQPDTSAYDAMLQALQDGADVDDAFFDDYRQSDYDKWFSKQIAFTQQQLDEAYEQHLTDKQQQALKAQIRPGQEAASEIDKLLADGKAAEAETKIDDAVAALDERLAGFEQANKLWERYRSAAIRNAASVPATDALIPSTPAREADLTGAIDDLEAELQKEPERYGMNAADVATFVSLLRQRTLLQTQGRAAVSAVQAQAQQQERQDAIEREAQRVNEKYAALDEEKDFESKSAQSDEVLAALDDPYQQNMYRAVNRIMDEGYNPIYGNWGVVAKGEPVTLSMWIQVGLTDEERARYNYLVATQGGAAGEQYIKDLKPQLQRRYAEVTDERQQQTAKELPVLSSLASVYMQFPAAVEGTIAMAGTLGDEDYVQNNPAMFSGTRFIQNVRESVAEGMSPTGQFFYQTGMSILDNVARLPLRYTGLGVMGSSVLSSTVNDYVAKGYSGGDALALGVGAAAIEVLTEKISLDNLMSILRGGATRLSRSALQQAVKEAFQQSIYEGSEEMASEILNYFWESAVIDDGEYDQAVARYEAMGLTKNQAVAQALRDKLPDVLLAGAGGFLSGLVMGGGGSLIAEWRGDTAAGDGFGGNAVQQAQAGREIRLAYQEAVKEDGHVLGDEAARQLKEDLQTLGVAKETARTVLQGVDMPNAWASDGLRTAMESVYETARSEAARVEARAARTEAAELKSSQRLGALMEKFTAAQAQANAARGQNDLKGYLAAVEDMRGAVSNYQNALAVEEKAGEARQIETQEQTRKSTAATEKAVAAAQPAVQEGYARVAAKIANERAATAEQFGAQQAAGQAQNAAGQAEAGPDQRAETGQGDTGRGSDAPASTAKGAAQVDVMDELVRGAGTAVSAQETEGTGARARSAMEAAMDGTEEPGARPAGQGKRRYRAGVNRADTAVRLDAADRMQLRVLDGLGKKYGVKIVIEDSIRYEDGEGRVYAGTSNGYYDRSDGTIHVALDAEGGAYLFFAVHELTHRLRAENADAYAALEAFVLNKLETSKLYGALTQGEGGTLEERIASVQALYAARGQELSRGEALEELVCDAIPVILTDEQAVRELVRTDRTLAERIRDFFEEFYHELTRQLAGVVYGPGNRVEAAALMNDAETVRELAELFRMALESSADLQYELLTQSGSAIEEAGTGAKDRRFSIVTLQNGSTFVKADGDKVIRGSDPNAWASQVENYILSIVNDRGRLDIPTADGSVLTITGYGTRESHTTAGELSNFNDYYDENGLFDEESARVRAQASLYIDEVVKISRDEGKRAVADRRAEHGEIAVNGWKYRNVHFMDTDGSYYQITLGVPQAIGGRQTAYSLGNVRRRRSPIDLGSSLSGAPKDGTPSVDSIRSAMGKSNTLDEKSGGNLHDESLNTKDVPKFSMRTDEGEDGRAAYVSDGTDAGRGRRLSARADGDDTITMEDVTAIQSIGRKSVNAFSSDEIRTAEPFARRYWRELGVKSPFFRAWFGDWRANDRTPVQLVRVAGADAPKSGRAINADTGRPISWGDRLRSETWAHGTKNALESIKGIDRIIETAVLLDTETSTRRSKGKLSGTAFMHSLYSLVDDGSGLTLYRLFAEEAVPAGGGDPFTRAYELKEIKKVATAPYGVLSVSGGLTKGAPATIYTVADLFAFVKENVPDFQPKPVHPALLNEEGTPKVFYHGTGSEFYEFSTEQIGAREGSFFFAENPEDAAGYGRNVMPVYLSAENLADYDAQPSEFYRLENKRAQVAYLKERGYDGWYADMDSDGWGEISVFSPEQIKSATDNAGTFDRRNQNIRFSQKAGEGTESAPGRIYDYSKPFAEQVDDWMAGRTPQYDTLLIGRTPLLYRQIGLSDVPMTIDQTHLDYMINGTKNADHHLGVALVRQLPELLEHPVAVIESATRPGDSVMAIVRGKVNGKQLVAAVRIGGNGVQNGAQIDSNHIVSAQGRGNAVTKLLNDALQKELRGEVGVYYWNKNEALPLIVDSGVQFPGRLINDGLIHSIFDAASPVNRNYLEQTETRQFKRWFGRSSVVKADGTPRAVRQGVDATVEVLDGKTALQDGEAVYVKLENPYRAGTAAEVPGRAALEAGGYDGAVYQDGNGGTHYAVLDGTQLKSATDNAGTFDGRNPNLRFSEKAAAEERDVAPAVSEKVLGNVAKRILQRTGSGYSAAQLTDGLKTLLHTDAEQRRETADALARQVLAESRERDDRMYDRTLEARAYFRRGKFRLNETQKAEMAYRYNSYGNYRKSLMGKLNLVNSGGSYLDSVWGEICELFPEYFSPDTSEGDQPQKLKEFLDMAYARPEVNPYEQFHGMEDAAAALADELVETVENIGRRPAPERYLEDGRDAEAWEEYWSEVKAGAKGRPAVQRPATRSERLRKAWELFDNGMTPVQYLRQSREEIRQASELRLFDDGQPVADTFDPKTNNLLRGLMLQNGERVGGALPDDELRRVTDIMSRAKRRVAAALSLSAPVRVFEDVTGWGGDTAAERAQNVKDGNYLKNTYYEYGNLQAANRELWISEKMRVVLDAVQGHGEYGALESAVTQMLGEGFVAEEQAEAAVSDGKTMIVEAQEGGVFVLRFGRDGKARLLYSSDGKTTTTYDEDFHDRVRRAAGRRSLRALLPVPKTEAGGLHVERIGGDVSVLTEGGKPVARVENGTNPNMPAVKAAVGALQQFYTDTYDEIASVRVENGYAPPGYIENYFPHQSRVYDGVEGFVEALMENDLPTGINGMTGTFSPGQPWNANLQKRFGTYTEFDAIRGFNRYVRGAADTIFYTPVIQRLRQLEQALRQQGTDALTAEDARRNAALVDWVHEYANEWSNKKSSFDRGTESLVGREGYSVSGMLTSLVSQSSVGGNLSSAMSNLISGLTGMAQVDARHALREGLRTTWQLLRRFDKRGGYDGFAEQIPFMQRRFSENEDILLTKAEKFRRSGSKALYAVFSELDRWAVESVARAKYAACLDAGMTRAQAIAATNDLLVKNFADRGKGQAPRIFNVKAIKPVVQFQLEVLNQLHHFRDMDRAEVEDKLYELEQQYGQDVPWDELEKKALSGGGLRKLKKQMAYLALLSLWGLLTREIMGRDQTWNPLGMAVDAVQDIREGGAEQAGEGILEAVMDNVPFVSVLSGGGRVPLASNLSNVTKAVESILLDKDFENADLVQAGTSFLPGGGQLRKTIQGAQANAAGGKYTKDGRLQYPIEQDEFWKTLLFGPSAAAPQGYDWTDALTKTETAAYDTLVEQGYDPQDLYDTLLGYGGRTNAEKALSLLANRGEWDDGELNMIAELLGLDAGGSLEQYARRETDRYLANKREELAKGTLTQQDYDAIEHRLNGYWADVHPGA